MIPQGLLIKKLRKERKLSQEKLAAGICSREAVNAFENRGTNLSSGILFHILNRLCIEPEEYLYLLKKLSIEDLNNYLELDEEKLQKELAEIQLLQQLEIDQKSLNKEFQNFATTPEKGDEFIRKLELAYHQTSSPFYQLKRIEFLLLNAFYQGNSLKEYQKECRFLKKYLAGIEIWCRFQMELFTNCLFIYSTDEILAIFESEMRLEYFVEERKFHEAYLGLLTNVEILLFQRQEYTALKKFFTQHRDNFAADKVILRQGTYLFMAEVLRATEEKTTAEVAPILSGLRLLGFPNAARQLQRLAITNGLNVTPEK